MDRGTGSSRRRRSTNIRIPLYRHHGHLVGFAAFKNHLSLFVTNSAVGDQFAKELEPYKVEGTTIRFSVDNPAAAGTGQEDRQVAGCQERSPGAIAFVQWGSIASTSSRGSSTRPAE
jgi:hypothetical protein